MGRARRRLATAFAPLLDLTGESTPLVPTDEHEAMRRDFEAAGNDLRTAIRTTKESVQAEHPELELVEA
ncbi:MAG TPA: hypothetical protein VEA16_13605 [Vicinamibacterales bacterium]|nr:hypothetical protein [Vicinamibacterales bacterium]